MVTQTNPKPFAFVIMPFDKSFEDNYNLGIKVACKNAGAYAERVDEQIYTEGTLERVYNQISKADIIISDMSNRNPNVFYETGYAHALGKRVILLTKNAEDIPFDLKHYSHIIYNNISSFIPELEKRVRWAIENPNNEISTNNVNLYIRGRKIQEDDSITFKIPLYDNSFANIEIDANNSCFSKIQKASFQIGIIASSRISEFKSIIKEVVINNHQSSTKIAQNEEWATLEKYKQPSGDQTLHFSEFNYTIAPEAWDKINLVLVSGEGGPFRDEEITNIILKLYFEDSVYTYYLTSRFSKTKSLEKLSD